MNREVMRFGIIGCGTIAQIMHVPHVAEIPGVAAHAVADPATERAAVIGDRYGVDHQFASAEEMVADIGSELDAVVVSTPPSQHASVVETTLGADIPTLVEKPLAVSPSDADRMVEAAAASEATAMVAYMKRYDPAYEAARARVTDLETVDLVTAYDVDPDHGRIIDEVYDIVDGDLPDDVLAAGREKQVEDSMAAIGLEDSDAAEDYHWHLEHVCHDVNLLRGLFGEVERVQHVDRYADGRYVTANLVYDGGVRCTLDSGLSERSWFEEFLRVDGPDGTVRLEFGNPFVRNVPTKLEVKRGTDERSTETQTPSYEESFKRELEHFVRCIKDGSAVRTPFTEARDDVRLIADLFRTCLGVELLDDH